VTDRPFPWELLALAALLAVNRAIVPRVLKRAWLFWAIQGLDVVAAGLVILVGMPGMERYHVVNWMIAALLVFHIVQNLAQRDRAKLHDEHEAAMKERRTMLRELRKDEDER
jgi:hypothetical protein